MILFFYGNDFKKSCHEFHEFSRIKISIQYFTNFNLLLQIVLIVYRLALIAVEILFSIALGLNPRQLKKDCNGKQENGLQKCPIPKLREFASNKKAKLHYF
jgi:Na+-transporting NADH:ubiquinone oxidoreductase subunit NqrC